MIRGVCRVIVATVVLVMSLENQTRGAANALLDDPPAVQLLTPLNGADGLPLTVTLRASVSDPEGSPLRVKIYGRALVEHAPLPEFSVVVLPDTQYYCYLGSEHFLAQTQWIVETMWTDNLVYVTHLGDIVESRDTVPAEWEVANTALSVLDSNIPYGLTPGNHDLDAQGIGFYYDWYFPASRYQAEYWYGGAFAPSNYKSNYQLLSVAGINLLFLNLEVDYPESVVSWANNVLEQYPDSVAVVSTHVYLDNNGFRFTEPDFRVDGQSGQYLWENLISLHDNVKLVLCGHVCEAARSLAVNSFGHEVMQILSDYQCRPNGGDGWLRVMTFAPNEDNVYVRTYSPTLDQYLTEPEHDFAFSLQMNPYLKFHLLAEYGEVSSGDTVEFTWSELMPCTPHDWYVVVEDAAHSLASETWSFMTGWPPTPTSTPSPVSTATPEPCRHTGDVNTDGLLTANDAQLAFAIAVGWYTPNAIEACAADCNNDEAVTAGDAQTIFGAVLNLTSCVDPLSR